jgi:glycosyltransferase involved in cell wall biosynthesis
MGARAVIGVTHIIAGLAPDGAERMLHRLVAGMDPNRFENEVISLTDLGPMAEKIEAAGVRVRALGMHRGSANPYHLIRLAAWLRKLPQQQVIQTWMYHADLMGGLAARLAGCAGVVWNIRHSELHPGVDKRHTILTAKACAKLSRWLPRRIICCSDASKTFHAKLGYSSDRMEVIPNGFDLELLRPDSSQRASVRQELGIDPSTPLIGYVARKHPVKDHRTFFEAAGLLYKHFPAAHFLLCGEGLLSNDPELRAWAEDAGVQGVCHFIGRRDDVPRILNALDLAASTSTSEAFPNTLAEAMACGIPCAVTDVGDSRAIIGETGSVTPVKDPGAMARSWADLLAMEPNSRKRLGEAARKRIEQNYGLTSVVRRYEDLYARVVCESPEAISDPGDGEDVRIVPNRQVARTKVKGVALSSHRPRVLFVDNDVNSFFSYRIEMARAARDAGFDVHVAAPEGKSAEILRAEGLSFHPIPMTRSGLAPWKEFTTIAVLFRLYRRLGPDLVHHLRLKPVLYGGLAAYGARVPAVVGLLTGLGYVFIAETRKALVMRKLVVLSCKVAFKHGNQRIIFQNPDDQGVFIQNQILPASQTALIKGSGVDIHTYLPTPEPEGVPVVVLASRMLRDKGVIEFVDAARSLHAAGVSARFVLVGETDPGNPTAISAEQLRGWADEGIVEWWGHQTDMKKVLAQANVVCLPSLREGVPKVLIEAAACGRSIVTTDAPGCREIVRNGENGLLVPVRDSKALADALRLLIESAPLRALMGAKGREIAVSEFSVERVIHETLGVYRELLAGGPNRSREFNIAEQQAR